MIRIGIGDFYYSSLLTHILSNTQGSRPLLLVWNVDEYHSIA
jgi:hypothetical protein